METGDPRQASFSAARFKDGIKFAMRMGVPETEDERVTFQWNTLNTFDTLSSTGDPYDWTSSPTSTTSASNVPLSLTVPAAVEFFDSKSSSGETAMGDFDIGRLKITILDDEWALLQDVSLSTPDTALVDGNIYDIDYAAPPIGLFTVTVYTLFASARDES